MTFTSFNNCKNNQTFIYDHIKYLWRLLFMRHKNITSTYMVQGSFSFVFRIEGFRKKGGMDGLHVFLSQSIYSWNYLLCRVRQISRIKNIPEAGFQWFLNKSTVPETHKFHKKYLARSTAFSNFAKNELIHMYISRILLKFMLCMFI